MLYLGMWSLLWNIIHIFLIKGQLCPAFPCINGGTCVTSGSTNYCICQPGYDNSTKCVTELDECASSPCVNGQCIDAFNSFTCLCNPGYSGHRCEIDINECSSNPCGHGECIDQVNGYRCQCHDAYYGLYCRVYSISHYFPVISKEEAGQFLQKRSTRNCNINRDVSCCTDRTHETWCEQPSSKSYCAEINEPGRESQCSPSTCGAGFSCYLAVPCRAHYRTNCYKGELCPAFPCLNGGTCVKSGGSNYCICPPGYDNSTKCVTKFNQCPINPCVHGQCFVVSGASKCFCNPGYSGTKCEIDINECSSNPCQNGATCRDLVNMYSCTCVPGYIGVNCQTEINECNSNPCQNGATCDDLINQYNCTCVPGYTGVNCQTDINECASNPCVNGQCTDEINAFNCTCDPGYTGIQCETDINECLSNPCDHGECVDQVNGYRCQCDDAYYGLHCQIFDTQVLLSLISLLPILAVAIGIIWFLVRRRLRERENTRRGLVPFKDTSLGGAATKFNVWTLGKDHPYGHFPSSASDTSSTSSRSSSRAFLQ